MKILSIETSTKKFSVALSSDKKIVRYKSFTLEKLLSSSIIPNIEKVLNSAGWNLKNIDGFAVGLGPGSFTSLRVGLSTIKAFAFATNKPVIGISSLNAIAMNVKEDCSQICVVSDARRNMVYSCLYAKSNSVVKTKGEYILASIDEVLPKIKGKAVFVGDGINLYSDKIKSSGKAEKFEDEKEWYPHANQIAIIAVDKYTNKEFEDASALIPLYLYADDCQVHKKVKGK